MRPEIQALRAVAVTLVLVYHLWPGSVPGGFIGVDVFFVISGFLITSHLVREVVRDRTVSVTQFWARRIRRLLPASYTVLLASFVAVQLWVPRPVWEQAYAEIAASAGYVVNWLLAFNSVDYLAAANQPSIVQHYWSLAVEEQFYVVWPLLILLAVAIARRLRPSRSVAPADLVKSFLLPVAVALGFVALSSFAFSIFETARSQPFAYFITPTRAWEFAAGGLLAFVPGGLPTWVRSTYVVAVRSAASWVGLVAIGLAALTFSGTSPFPGYIALLPVLGAALVIWAGDVQRRWAPTAVAPFRPIQLVGDLSYSIYLWHWPLIVLYPYLRGHGPELKGGLLICAASFALAWVTKVLVEDPFRTRRFWTASRAHTYAMAGAGMVVTLTIVGSATLALQHDRQIEERRLAEALSGDVACFGAAAMVPGAGCPSPFAVPATLDPEAASHDKGLIQGAKCDAGFEGVRIVSCAVGDPGGGVGLAIVGNSHALALASGLDPYARENGWQLDTYVRLGCLGAALEQVADDYPSATCVEWSNRVIDRLVADPDIDVVIFQSYVAAVPADLPPDARRAVQTLWQATWSRLLDAGKKVVVIGDPPGMRPDADPACVSQAMHEYDPCRRPVSSFRLSNAMFSAAVATRGVTAIDITKYFCDTKFCHAVIGGVVVYFDAHHLTKTYAVTLCRIIGKQLADLLGA